MKINRKTTAILMLAITITAVVAADSIVIEEGEEISFNNNPIFNLQVQEPGEPPFHHAVTVGYIEDSLQQIEEEEAQLTPDTFQAAVGNLNSLDQDQFTKVGTETTGTTTDQLGQTKVPRERPFQEDIQTGTMWIEGNDLVWHYEGTDIRISGTTDVTDTENYQNEDIPYVGTIFLKEDTIRWVSSERRVIMREGETKVEDITSAEHGDIWISDGDTTFEDELLISFITENNDLNQIRVD